MELATDSGADSDRDVNSDSDGSLASSDVSGGVLRGPRIDDKTRRAEWLVDGRVVVFTDGACRHNQDKRLRRAGYSCFWGLGQARNVARPLVGALQTNAQLFFADVASRNLRDSKHESLTASWPFWEGCPVAVERQGV